MTTSIDERRSWRSLLAAPTDGLATLMPWRSVGAVVPDYPAAVARGESAAMLNAAIRGVGAAWGEAHTARYVGVRLVRPTDHPGNAL